MEEMRGGGGVSTQFYLWLLIITSDNGSIAISREVSVTPFARYLNVEFFVKIQLLFSLFFSSHWVMI